VVDSHRQGAARLRMGRQDILFILFAKPIDRLSSRLYLPEDPPEVGGVMCEEDEHPSVLQGLRPHEALHALGLTDGDKSINA
jgi:hypothetical protein